VQLRKRIATVLAPHVEGKVANGVIRVRQGGIAQEQAWRKALQHAAHDALGILRFHRALDIDAQLRERSVGGKHMGEIAERILVRVEPRVARDVDSPVDDILAFVVARGEPQHLDDARGRWLVAMNNAVGDTQTHI
jgi:hypothetical protein